MIFFQRFEHKNVKILKKWPSETSWKSFGAPLSLKHWKTRKNQSKSSKTIVMLLDIRHLQNCKLFFLTQLLQIICPHSWAKWAKHDLFETCFLGARASSFEKNPGWTEIAAEVFSEENTQQVNIISAFFFFLNISNHQNKKCWHFYDNLHFLHKPWHHGKLNKLWKQVWDRIINV